MYETSAYYAHLNHEPTAVKITATKQSGDQGPYVLRFKALATDTYIFLTAEQMAQTGHELLRILREEWQHEELDGLDQREPIAPV